MGEEAEVAEDLELLADLIADVTVVGVEFFQFGCEGVDFFVGEGGLAGGKRWRATALRDAGALAESAE